MRRDALERRSSFIVKEDRILLLVEIQRPAGEQALLAVVSPSLPFKFRGAVSGSELVHDLTAHLLRHFRSDRHL
jgi:hypothetical protein